MRPIIRFLTQHFYPDSASTGNLLTELAISLASRGFKIEVYTSQPLDNIKVVSPKYEEYKGVKIFRLTSTRLNKNNKFGKVYNFFAFFWKTFFKVLFTSGKKNYYLYFIVSNPPFLPLIGSFMNFFKKIDYIHLLYDLQPDQGIAIGYISGKNIIFKVWKWFNRFIYKRAAHTVVLSEQMVETVKEKMRIAKADKSKYEEISIIDNWANGDYLKPIPYSENKFIKENNLEGKFILNYSGNLGAFQKFDSLISAAEKLDKKDYAFIFVGDGIKKKKLMKDKETKQLDNVYFFPYQPKSILPHVQAASHLSIVHLEREIEGFAFPSKLYSILASGSPILALCQNHSRLAKIINEAQCGYVKQHEDIDGIVRAIMELKENPEKIIQFGKNARKFFEENYTLELATNKYEKIFKKFIDKNS